MRRERKKNYISVCFVSVLTIWFFVFVWTLEILFLFKVPQRPSLPAPVHPYPIWWRLMKQQLMWTKNISFTKHNQPHTYPWSFLSYYIVQSRRRRKSFWKTHKLTYQDKTTFFTPKKNSSKETSELPPLFLLCFLFLELHNLCCLFFTLSFLSDTRPHGWTNVDNDSFAEKTDIFPLSNDSDRREDNPPTALHLKAQIIYKTKIKLAHEDEMELLVSIYFLCVPVAISHRSINTSSFRAKCRALCRKEGRIFQNKNKDSQKVVSHSYDATTTTQ